MGGKSSAGKEMKTQLVINPIIHACAVMNYHSGQRHHQASDKRKTKHGSILSEVSMLHEQAAKGLRSPKPLVSPTTAMHTGTSPGVLDSESGGERAQDSVEGVVGGWDRPESDRPECRWHAGAPLLSRRKFSSVYNVSSGAVLPWGRGYRPAHR